jgi:Atypical PilZ domain, cyclic di-GMP receptor
VTDSFEGLGYADAVPLGFERLDKLPDGAALAGLNRENQQVLVADASLDDQRALVEKKPDEEHELAEDVQRLEFKVNVLIQLVAQLVSNNSATPPVTSVRLYGNGLDWLLRGEAVPDGVGIVALHVSRHFPQPLRLPGRIVGSYDDGEGRWVRFAFERLTPVVVELLERLVFRHHRRLVAGTRTTPRG